MMDYTTENPMESSDYYDNDLMDNFTTSASYINESDVAKCKPQEYYAFKYAVIGTLLQSIIFIVGVLGNVLVCAVVCRTRSMHSTTNCYLVSLAVADTITLVASVPNEVLSYHILGDQWVWGQVGCTLIIYLQYLGIDASALSLTAFTVERYIAICHPMKSKSICTISRAKKIILGCWVFAIIYCSPWFLLTQIKTECIQGIGEVQKCKFRLKRNSTEYLVMFFMDLMLFYVLPLILSVVLYTLIARMLLANSKNKFPGGVTSNGQQAAATTLSVSEAAAKSNQSRVQVVKMLACVVMIFATLWVPYRGLLVYNSFATMNHAPPYLDLWYLMFAKTCIYTNCAINPILYNAMSDKFRKAFRRLLSCGKMQGDDSHIQRYRFQSRYGAGGGTSYVGQDDSSFTGVGISRRPGGMSCIDRTTRHRQQDHRFQQPHSLHASFRSTSNASPGAFEPHETNAKRNLLTIPNAAAVTQISDKLARSKTTSTTTTEAEVNDPMRSKEAASVTASSNHDPKIVEVIVDKHFNGESEHETFL